MAGMTARVPIAVGAMGLMYIGICKYRFDKLDQDKGEHRRHTLASLKQRVDREQLARLLQEEDKAAAIASPAPGVVGGGEANVGGR